MPDHERASKEAAMDMNEYVVRFLVRERLASAREQARRRALVPLSTRRPLRARVGATLVALGHHLLQEIPPPRRVTS
jgi:hypothetical protein